MEMLPKQSLVFLVNGKKIEDLIPNPTFTLLQYLRQKLCLTGSKNACSQGACGACTVVLSWKNWDGSIRHRIANSCMVPILAVQGISVTSIEALGSADNGLHCIQKRLVDCSGLQCGFCTPGFVMSMYGALVSKEETDIENVLEGNLCRCTGYGPILEALKSFNRTDEVENGVKITENLQCLVGSAVDTNGCQWFRPVDEKSLMTLLSSFPDAVIVAGATALISVWKQCTGLSGIFIHVAHISEMNVLHLENGNLIVGASVTLNDLNCFLFKWQQDNNNEKNDAAVKTLLKCIGSIGSPQIRNQATIGGSVMLNSKLSDIAPVLVAFNAELTFVHEDTTVTALFENLNKEHGKYEKFLLKTIKIPLNLSDKNFQSIFFKQSQRATFDYANMNACVCVHCDDHGGIESMTICVGTLKEMVWNMTDLGEKVTGMKLSDSFETLQSQLVNMEMEKQKRLLLTNWLKIFCTHDTDHQERPQKGTRRTRKIEYDVTDKTNDPVGQPMPVLASPYLVTGEAMFTSDLPKYKEEVFVALVLSSVAHGRIKSVDTTKALDFPGIVGYIDHTSITGENAYGVITKDDLVFAESEVFYNGQIIGAVVGKTEEEARMAARLVTVDYEELPSILTIQEAISKESFFPSMVNELQKGDPDEAMKSCDHVLEGTAYTGHQEHMCMETGISIAVPKKESGEIEIWANTQHPASAQKFAASLTGFSQNKFVIHQRRIGGGFGSKESQCKFFIGPSIVAAQKYKRPARCALSRKEETILTGKRSPFTAQYKVGVTREGKIKSLIIKLYADGGWSLDLSSLILEAGVISADAAYCIENMRVSPYLCKTNTPSNTAFRGFGIPEVAYIMQKIIQNISMFLMVPIEQIIQLNITKENAETLLGMVVRDCTLPRCWEECLKISSFQEEKKKVESFNSHSKWIKRAISMMPCAMAIGFPATFLNQGGALVNVYEDGSVSLYHGGVEMGQGLHTKMIQVAACVLEIPVDLIYTNVVSSTIVPNCSTTGASFSSDLCGFAVKNACEKIKSRIQRYKDSNPNGSWKDWISAAYYDRTSLSATGFSRPGDKYVDYESKSYNKGLYFTFGVGCTVAEVDGLTGKHQVISQHIVMDVGKSLNPVIDVGQIEGAFMQGYGWMTMEEINFLPSGQIAETGPGNYRIPNVSSYPKKMHVSLLRDSAIEQSVYSSKGIGEPPLILSIGVYIALRAAIQEVRNEKGFKSNWDIDIPLTTDKIFRACNMDCEN